MAHKSFPEQYKATSTVLTVLISTYLEVQLRSDFHIFT